MDAWPPQQTEPFVPSKRAQGSTPLAKLAQTLELYVWDITNRVTAIRDWSMYFDELGSLSTRLFLQLFSSRNLFRDSSYPQHFRQTENEEELLNMTYDIRHLAWVLSLHSPWFLFFFLHRNEFY